jgi:LPS sulfotransferase NodH
MKKFIIISTQRSGSSLLVTTLASHPKIECFREIFLEENTKPDSYTTYSRASFSRKLQHWLCRKRLVEQYITQFLGKMEYGEVVGFKFMYSQDKILPQVIDWVEREQIKVIHLIRINSLKKRVSRLVSRFRNLAHSTERVEVCRISVDTARLKEKLDSMSQEIDQYRSRLSHLNPLEITYEDLVANQDRELQRVLDFLEIDVFPGLSTELVKVNSDRLSDVIENYDEVVQALFGTEHEQFLD